MCYLVAAVRLAVAGMNDCWWMFRFQLAAGQRHGPVTVAGHQYQLHSLLGLAPAGFGFCCVRVDKCIVIFLHHKFSVVLEF